MTIGDKIADARKRNNLTQEQLGDLMQVTRQSISRWESNTSYPEMEKLIQLSEILDFSLDYLLKDVEKTEMTSQTKDVSRLLKALEGKTVKLSFYSDAMDMDLYNTSCKIVGFEADWLKIAYTKKKKVSEKLLPMSSILSVKIETEA